MTVVVDANLLASQVLPLPHGDLAIRRLRLWQLDDEEMIAPTLLEYELATIMRKALLQGWLSDTPSAVDTLRRVLRTGPRLIAPDDELDREALVWAQRIGQNKADDAQYLALAVRENATLWTLDRRLARGAEQAGLRRVQWLGDWKP